MRVHHLTVTAFGPYAGTQTVDFDELNESGVFLLTGPTGAGKTSILDAICFALYGVVPGARGVKTLRSHHAHDEARPEVVLEVTLGDRRYRVRRSPEWQRPKKRGTGSTKQQASATLVELADDGTERLVSSRVAEVGHELTMALGMRPEQFMQVVLLPQGEFQTFLRASSDERQGVLERLFHTQRFARIEDWMRDHTRGLASAAATGERRVAQLLGTLSHRSPVALPEDLAAALAADSLGDVAPSARAWSAAAVAAADDALVEAERALTVAEQEVAEAEAREREAVRRQEALDRRRTARAVLEQLDGDRDAEEGARLLARHEAAWPLRGLLIPLDGLAVETESLRRRRDRAVAGLGALPPGFAPDSADPDAGDSARRRLTDALAHLRAVLPREREIADLRLTVSAEQTALAALRAESDETSARAGLLPAQREEAAAALEQQRAVAAGLEAARRRQVELTERHAAAEALPDAGRRHTELRERHLAACDRAADARQHHLDLVERRLRGMAAELAGQLVDDHPCVVCGSEQHPRPASAAPDAVTEEEQRAATAQEQRLRSDADALSRQVQDAAEEVRRLETLSGGQDADALRTELRRAADGLAAAEHACARVPELEARLDSLLTEERGTTERLQQLSGSLAATAARLAAAESAVAAREAELLEALREHGLLGDGPADVDAEEGATPDRVRRAVRLLEAGLPLVEEARDARAALEVSEARRREAVAHAEQAARDAGFASVDDARGAVLAEADADVLRVRLRAREDRRRSAEAVLGDAVLQEAATTEGPTVEEARTALRDSRAEHGRRAALLGAVRDTASSVRALAGELDEALVAWEPARLAHETAEGMSRLVRGLGSDNQLQMRLSSYVLATRLDQVLEAANERLSHMRDQRYALRRCGAARGNARAGLGLEVLDAWTGEERSPATLSGGETFVVSLALALGLADVVAHESGGLRVDTLFIDEGFGMLDPDTLDDVMDRIDALRAGGRTVGVVSHVTELRGRIPTQVHVTRGRDGSTVEVRTLVA